MLRWLARALALAGILIVGADGASPPAAAQGFGDFTAPPPKRPTPPVQKPAPAPQRTPQPETPPPQVRTLPPAGQSFRDCPECPEMVVIPPGTFTMGSPGSEEGRYGGEGPLHQVRIGYALAVGKYEVTFAEWDACVAAGGCGGYRPSDAGWGRGNRPVINVSWDDAQQYVRWLSSRTGKRYRLLSEAEWEYAARAGTTTPFAFGSTISPDQANYDGNYTYAGGPKGVHRQQTVAVGSFRPNGWGLYDLHGNVWEWVEDCYNGSYAGAPGDGSAWTSEDCGKRVLRGGSWLSLPWDLRSAIRVGYGAGYRYYNNGFRVARTN